MASSHGRPGFVEPLPPHPSLEMQQKRAKDLLRAAAGGDADALSRIRALHPRAPAPEALKLADAQLVVARGYGFGSWAAMKEKIESLTLTPREQFVGALRSGNVERVRALLTEHPDVRAAVNAPLGDFGARPVHMAKKNLPVLDVLLAYGADLNLKSDWGPGGFGILEHGCTPEEAAPLIARGAVMDVFAAAHLGMFDRLRELVERDPSLVHARGGDGKTALHCARTVEIARYLLDRGADIDARDVDHESTAAQYLVREAPDVARLLVDRGAWVDIFMAIGLRDVELVKRCLRDDPDALDHRIWHGKYSVGHNPENQGMTDRRGDVYRWVFNHNASAIDVANALGYDDILAVLVEHATPAQRLLAACANGDRATAESLVASHPGIVSSLAPAEMRLIVDRAHANDTAAVALMLDLGFDPLARGVEEWEAIRWAAFHGNAEMLARLLPHNPPIGIPDPSYGGTPLQQCIYGSLHGWHCHTGDFATTVRLLLEAGDPVDASYLPTGRDDVDDVIRRHLRTRGAGL